MPDKRIELVEVRDRHHDHVATVPIGTVEGAGPGRTLGVLAGVHGTEYAAQDAVLRFWHELDPARVVGRLLVVLVADTTALTHKSAYLNPVDGKNLNRVWPGSPDGTLTEVIAHAVTERVVSRCDALVDVHGGEWDEAISAFVITHRTGNEDLDARTLALAVAAGFPYVEVGPAEGRGTGSAAAMMAGIPAMTFEAGGEGLAERRYVEAHLQGLRNVGRHLGILPGDLTSWAGAPVVVDHGVMIRTTRAGIVRPAVQLGDWVEAGQVFSEILDFDGTLLETIRAPETGAVIDVITSRGIREGGFAGKIVVCPSRPVDGVPDPG
jgi:predicted deacylase